MVRPAKRCLYLTVAIFSLYGPSFSQQIPKTELTTLTGIHLVVPREAAVKPLLVLATFSHEGASDATAWNKHFKVQYETDPRIDYDELADFQGVPSLVMKMILHGMRRSVQEPERSHLSPFYAQEQDWKQLVSFSDSKITYVVLADASGHVVWQTHGPASDAKAAELEAAIVRLQAHAN